MSIILYLPFPPTVNSYYQVIARHRGMKRISKAGLAFRNAVEIAVAEQAHLSDPLFGNLHVEVILHAPDQRKRDLDNYMKALLDACTQVELWLDDSQIDQLTILRGEVVQKGLVRLEINEAGPVIPLSFTKANTSEK